jgi:SAM-dependent methyltransferase
MQSTTKHDDPFFELKKIQKESWGLFAPLEAVTIAPAAELVRFSGLQSGQRVLDVGTGTGVVAVTAASAGAKVSGLDLSPKLIERARHNAALARVEVNFVEGDAESLPYADSSFEVVLSQFGHMFAPRPEVAIGEMLRVLKPGGTIAFSTWPPDHFTGSMFALVGRYVPPPTGAAPPPQWGDPNIVKQRLGDAVTELVFDRGVMNFPALSPAHYRTSVEITLAPVVKLVETSKNEPEKLESFRRELETLISHYLDRNVVHQHFLMTRARKK